MVIETGLSFISHLLLVLQTSCLTKKGSQLQLQQPLPVLHEVPLLNQQLLQLLKQLFLSENVKSVFMFTQL